MVLKRFLIGKFSYLLSYIIPTNKNYFLYSSSPDYCDNAYAVFQYLVKMDVEIKITHIWLVANKDQTYKYIGDEFDIKKYKIRVLNRNSLQGYWAAFRSRYLFYTVGVYSGFCFRQKDKRINMWHGMPIKHIGFDICSGDYTVSTSELFVPYMSKGLKIPQINVLLVGQPRNDYLFHPELFCDSKLSLNNYKNIGIWMPTFRRSKTMTQHIDGGFNPEYISFLPISELEIINKLLRIHKSLLIIKFHPYDIFQENKIKDYSNIKFLYNSNFSQKDIYKLLANCNYMISDYSSVIIDFENLERPIGITISDYEEYKSTRGFDVESIPGKLLHSKEELVDFIKSNLDGSAYLEKYGQLYNKYKDGNSTIRLLNSLNIIDDVRF